MSNLKRFLALTLAMVMALSGMLISVSAAATIGDFTTNPFTGSEEDAAKLPDAINLLAELGVVAGKSVNADGTFNFRGDEDVSREQFALFVARIQTGRPNFFKQSDIPTVFSDDAQIDDWYKTAVTHCYEKGIVQGVAVDPLRYAPDNNIKFMEAIKMLVVALGYNTENYTYPVDFLLKAEEVGLWGPNAYFTFAGQDTAATINRYEMAMLLFNFLINNFYELRINWSSTGGGVWSEDVYTPVLNNFIIGGLIDATIFDSYPELMDLLLKKEIDDALDLKDNMYPYEKYPLYLLDIVPQNAYVLAVKGYQIDVTFNQHDADNASVAADTSKFVTLESTWEVAGEKHLAAYDIVIGWDGGLYSYSEWDPDLGKYITITEQVTVQLRTTKEALGIGEYDDEYLLGLKLKIFTNNYANLYGNDAFVRNIPAPKLIGEKNQDVDVSISGMDGKDNAGELKAIILGTKDGEDAKTYDQTKTGNVYGKYDWRDIKNGVNVYKFDKGHAYATADEAIELAKLANVAVNFKLEYIDNGDGEFMYIYRPYRAGFYTKVNDDKEILFATNLADGGDVLMDAKPKAANYVAEGIEFAAGEAYLYTWDGKYLDIYEQLEKVEGVALYARSGDNVTFSLEGVRYSTENFAASAKTILGNELSIASTAFIRSNAGRTQTYNLFLDASGKAILARDTGADIKVDPKASIYAIVSKVEANLINDGKGLKSETVVTLTYVSGPDVVTGSTATKRYIITNDLDINTDNNTTQAKVYATATDLLGKLVKVGADLDPAKNDGLVANLIPFNGTSLDGKTLFYNTDPTKEYAINVPTGPSNYKDVYATGKFINLAANGVTPAVIPAGAATSAEITSNTKIVVYFEDEWDATLYGSKGGYKTTGVKTITSAQLRTLLKEAGTPGNDLKDLTVVGLLQASPSAQGPASVVYVKLSGKYDNCVLGKTPEEVAPTTSYGVVLAVNNTIDDYNAEDKKINVYSIEMFVNGVRDVKAAYSIGDAIGIGSFVSIDTTKEVTGLNDDKYSNEIKAVGGMTNVWPGADKKISAGITTVLAGGAPAFNSDVTIAAVVGSVTDLGDFTIQMKGDEYLFSLTGAGGANRAQLLTIKADGTVVDGWNPEKLDQATELKAGNNFGGEAADRLTKLYAIVYTNAVKVDGKNTVVGNVIYDIILIKDLRP